MEIQYIAKAISANELRYDASLDHLRPAHSTSIGLVILAHIGEEALEGFLSSARLHRITERTTTDRTVLKALIARARRQGYAEVRDTNSAGVSGVSAPVFGSNGEIVAGLNLGAPSWRFPKVRTNLIRMVKRCAAELSTRLGNGRLVSLQKS
jgi:IclR family acetate operon transcriptional repressor